MVDKGLRQVTVEFRPVREDAHAHAAAAQVANDFSENRMKRRLTTPAKFHALNA